MENNHNAVTPSHSQSSTLENLGIKTKIIYRFLNFFYIFLPNKFQAPFQFSVKNRILFNKGILFPVLD